MSTKHNKRFGGWFYSAMTLSLLFTLFPLLAFGQTVTSVIPKDIRLEPGGKEVSVTITGTGLDKITSVQVVMNNQPVKEVLAVLGTPALKGRQVTLKASLQATIGTNYQLRLIIGTTPINLPAQIVQVEVVKATAALEQGKTPISSGPAQLPSPAGRKTLPGSGCPDPSRDVDGDCLDDALEDQLLQRFRPYYLFSTCDGEEDSYKPADVLWYIRQSNLIEMGDEDSPVVIANDQLSSNPKAILYPGTDITQTPWQSTFHINPLANPPHPLTPGKDPGRHGQDWNTILGNKNIGLYGHVVPTKYDKNWYYKIEYWQFFGYNTQFAAADLADHEGDWMTVQLLYDPTPPGRIVSVFHYAHGPEFRFDMDKTIKKLTVNNPWGSYMEFRGPNYKEEEEPESLKEKKVRYDVVRRSEGGIQREIELRDRVSGSAATALVDLLLESPFNIGFNMDGTTGQNNTVRLYKDPVSGEYSHPVVYIEHGGHEFWPTENGRWIQSVASGMLGRYYSHPHGGDDAKHSYLTESIPNLGEVEKPMKSPLINGRLAPASDTAEIILKYNGFWGAFSRKTDNPLGPPLHDQWTWPADSSIRPLLADDFGTTGETSPEAPALAVHNGNLYIAWTGKENQHLNVAVVNTQGNSITGLSQKLTMGDRSPKTPSLASFNGRLYIAWNGTDSEHKLNVMCSTDNGLTFGNKFTSGETSPEAPALAVHNGNLCIAWAGGNQHLYVALVNTQGNNITGFSQKQKLDDLSSKTPSLASLNGRLYIAWNVVIRPVGGSTFIPSSGKLNVMYSTDNGKTFGNKFTSRETSPEAPALTVHNSNLYITWTGTGNQHLNVAVVNTQGNKITSFSQKITLEGTSPKTPSLASLNRPLYIAWNGTASAHKLRVRIALISGDTSGAAEPQPPAANLGNRLGMLDYGWDGTKMVTKWGTGDMGQGAGALAWLVADVDGDRKAEIIQPWNNGGKLGMLVYSWDGANMVTKWGTGDMGQGSGALAWLVADVDGDRKAEIIQPWNNGGKLGMLVYSWDGANMVTKWGTGDMGQGAGALAWLVADVDGDGKTEIIQLWNNGGKLGMLVYAWDTSSKSNRMVTKWGTGDMGQGAGALAWLATDIDFDRKTEIIQLWNNGGKLGMLVYAWDASSKSNKMATKWGTGDMGQGAGALAWLAADVNGDRKAEIIQLWNNGGKLGMLVYAWDTSSKSNKMVAKWGTADMGQGAGALAWLVADVDGDGRPEIIQPWNNGGKLGLLVYGWDGTKMVTKWGTADMGQGAGALAWLVADVDGDRKANVIQPWVNTDGAAASPIPPQPPGHGSPTSPDRAIPPRTRK